MNNWNKIPVTKQQIEPLCKNFDLDKKLSDSNISQILASILVRRNITEGNELLYFLENDLRFQHSPFLLHNMEDAVDRILNAQEEKEKILIFGDSDVDGITSTAILFNQLKKMNFDVEWKLPQKDDEYGLNKKTIDDFYSNDGSLIITVDCGISNFESIQYANYLGIDVIVTDHHNPQENLPDAVAVVNPKIESANYPFYDISGAAVAYKLVSALRFAKSEFYKADICLLDIIEDKENNCIYIECLKTRNLTKRKFHTEKIIPGQTSISETKLPYFLSGQYIYVWDKNRISTLLKQLFGAGIEFNLFDLKNAVCSIMPKLSTFSTSDILEHSQIAKYLKEEKNQINALFNIFVTYVQRKEKQLNNDFIESENTDIQLVALAALADIMPMKNENRLFVKNGLSLIRKNGPCHGLAELTAKMRINPNTITSTDLSWTIIPALNAAGRLGNPNLALNLLLSDNPSERQKLAEEIFNLNEERKNLVTTCINQIKQAAIDSIPSYNNKLCVVVSENIHQGITGLLAGRLMNELGVPSIAVTFNNDECIGSIRSCRDFIATDFLQSFGDFFINFGGHNAAAGFSFKKEKLNLFLSHIQEESKNIQLSKETETLMIDAEIPPSYLVPGVFDLLDLFEPYGAENQELIFKTSDIKICDAMIVGKKEPYHLKLTLECGKYKFPAMFWGQGSLLKNDISIGKKINILYNLNKSFFNGQETPQLIIKDLDIL